MADKPVRRLVPVPLNDVTIEDRFWAPKLETNRRRTIPSQYKMLKTTGRIDALKLEVAPLPGRERHIFWESDLAKWIEAVGYTLSTHPDPKLEKQLDEVIALLAAAQQEDGYLNAYYTTVEPENRWTNLRDKHELYCAGHLMEAAAAHFHATGKRSLLDIACRFADHIDSVFGPGKRTGYPGHEEIELALVKLYHATGQERYLRLSEYFIDGRGQQPPFYDAEATARGEDPKGFWSRDYGYCQAHEPVREQAKVVGHAVRAMYLYCGMTDLAGERGDAALWAASRRLWDDLTLQRLYVTAGVGPSAHNEGFTESYDLPNESAYAESCAAIGLVFWAHRLLQVEPNGTYADAMERALYNGVLSGVSLDGEKFFYRNPLASSGRHHRQDWFGCACCPPNLSRILASVGAYAYSVGEAAFYVHLYVGGTASADVAGRRVVLAQKTKYPWDGDVRFHLRLEAPARFALHLRVPGWCPRARIRVNGKSVPVRVTRGYARLTRTWRDGDRVDLSLAMPIQRIEAHPAVTADTARLALQRGPIVYCLEEVDHRIDVRTVRLPKSARLTARHDRRLLGGVTVITGAAEAPKAAGWKGRLYRPLEKGGTKPIKLKAIPYYAWDNRSAGTMAVWLPRV